MVGKVLSLWYSNIDDGTCSFVQLIVGENCCKNSIKTLSNLESLLI
jgi:hypothetical protein